MIILSIRPQPSPDEAAAIELALNFAARSKKNALGIMASRWVKPRVTFQSNTTRASEFARPQQANAWARAARTEAIEPGV